MNPEHYLAYTKMEPPPEAVQKVIDDLKSPLAYGKPETGNSGGKTELCFSNGTTLQIDFPDPENLLETAYASFYRVMSFKNIVVKENSYPFIFQKDASLSLEEFVLETNLEKTVLSAADTEGLRRGIYFLEDRILETDGPAVTSGRWRRSSWVKHRISRCFFGPTYRGPFFIDELANDIDYYPGEYLNKLAHEGINGLWLTMYFRDFPSSIFTGRGKESEKRFAKLRLTVERCARYGIRIYIFLSEPKFFGNSSITIPTEDSDTHPELTGDTDSTTGFRHFCTSSEAGLKYLAESTGTLFKEVPKLGGLINIMFGEDNGACINDAVNTGSPSGCPRCADRNPGEIYRDCARVMTDAMHHYAPEAEFIGWFYAPKQRDNSPLTERLSEITAEWPEDATILFNMESGGVENQLGKARNVFDYSLAYIGPSELFRSVASSVEKAGAKIQVGCSHEDASVPFIPVPLNLYEKYRELHKYKVNTILQCWYFGNYPGLMNKAAGRLSFEPLPASEEEFLLELARPDWGRFATDVIQAWRFFSKGYRQFPANIGFEWYGPLHNSIVWPLHLFPVDRGIAPSWAPRYFPFVSGDRIGECLLFQHTLEEAVVLCQGMSADWNKGTGIFEKLRVDFLDYPARLADINLASAIGLQMKSTVNLLNFYLLREEMFYTKKNHLADLEKLVRDEISNTKSMFELCCRDPRLGYHSEAEEHLFYPQKLEARIQLLEELLEDDFKRFDMNASWADEWTGAHPSGLCVYAVRRGKEIEWQRIKESPVSWAVEYDEKILSILLHKTMNQTITVEIEPRRLWPPFRFDFDLNGKFTLYDFILRTVPEVKPVYEENLVRIDLPWSLFDGFRREGFPMRINIRNGNHSWGLGKPWPSRLLERDYNPECSGWLLLK